MTHEEVEIELGQFNRGHVKINGQTVRCVRFILSKVGEVPRGRQQELIVSYSL